MIKTYTYKIKPNKRVEQTWKCQLLVLYLCLQFKQLNYESKNATNKNR